ncbi:MAG: 30S ribosomal protein S8 [Candidatus Wolfebacteria bacterium GW2011_GWC2_46_275]|uniref:Small ribosomal subunit protein uS8 n=2 Tax=Candidatus Wolfeibacteriota TaxID=1752735 RepID=A0A0G1U8V4_9BACT|nr:MAG: 30S ribosomal protein S8 [Candidatus Wolfebacteria bacterium GW2011_GWB1_47_1]KKU36268.1 MAG: 30S ribosomal protein S8 [Candidatus Wolfebacteria bacterium GW2011_GWC2_46_275]KKU42133.1 MAG: 30S ribosomal protein S8 [Candidatus Wolfebacteria bacterium GW2011_GWB2_46_69]KKU54091.1 MAG: 30S ribosomal protein S8 [Candidatus Wolfebacteria bacterium GW2011_GWC1_47_103]KKU59278.1 MAG: 30S ribosomal protein S8 [Candidatus Wolfebacteria bacterium GW2011_GWE2_47_12]KKU66031.1 MAG: 30S ribosomal 
MYIDLLTQIKNAQAVKKESIKVPYTKNDERILEILASRKYITAYDKKGRAPKRVLSIDLKYEDGVGAIEGVRFVSRPSIHIYKGCDEIRPVKNGRGLAVVSTPKGIMTGENARKEKVGGEIFFEIW